MAAKQAADGIQTTTERIGGVNTMKKKFLLAIIPALMALSSCTYMQSATKAGMNANFLQEDTLAHEEIFDGSDLQLINPKQDDSNLPLRAPEDIVEPIIGVQYQEGTMEYDGQQRPVISFRYVAVINSRHVKAEWIRAVSRQDGHPLKAKATKESTVAYTAITNGDTYITAEDMGGTCFVVYTLYNIPLFEHKINGVDNCQWSYIAAGLKVTDLDDNTKSTMSKIVAVEIGARHHFSFSESTVTNAKPYFIEGRIGGNNNQLKVLDGDVSGETNLAKKRPNLGADGWTWKAGDNFGLFKWSSDDFKFYGNHDRTYDKHYIAKDERISTNYSLIGVDGDYTLYLNESGNYGLTAEETIPLPTTVYLNVKNTVWISGANNESFAVWQTSLNEWVTYSSSNDGLYTFTDVDTAHDILFVRYDKTKSPNWDWGNQTDNIDYDQSEVFIMNDTFTITGWSDGGGGHSGYTRSTSL